MTIKFKSGSQIIEFGVISVPYRKSKALFIARGANTDILAYFTSEENADIFSSALDKIVRMFDNSPASPTK